jgi:hypothetical protein
MLCYRHIARRDSNDHFACAAIKDACLHCYAATATFTVVSKQGPKHRLDYERPNRVKFPRDWRTPLKVAIPAALCVVALTLETARHVQSFRLRWSFVGHTELLVRRFQEDVDRYTRDNGHPPVQLSDLPEWSNYQGITDHWGRPFLLEHDNGRATVVSLGRDGVPGGTRWDMDIRRRGPWPPRLVSIPEFLRLAPVQTYVLAMGAGLFTGFGVMLLAPDRFVRSERTAYWIQLGWVILVTGAMSVLIGYFMAAVHVSGH